MAGEGEGGTNGESRTDICTLPCVKQGARGKLPYNTEPSLALRGGLEGRHGGVGGGSRGRGYMCIPMADSHCCATETHTIL